MSLRNAAARRARERARNALHSMPISDDETLLKLQGQAEEYLREAKLRNPSEPDVSSIIDAIMRDCFRNFLQKRKLTRRVLPILLILSVMTFIVVPAVAHTPYDGPWKVTVVTKTGSCEPTTSYALIVIDGKVSGTADLSGTVGQNGVVRASLHGAFAHGQLSGDAGFGKWNAASVGKPCSGRWTAMRQ
jgi:hypothetical protein